MLVRPDVPREHGIHSVLRLVTRASHCVQYSAGSPSCLKTWILGSSSSSMCAPPPRDFHLRGHVIKAPAVRSTAAASQGLWGCRPLAPLGLLSPGNAGPEALHGSEEEDKSPFEQKVTAQEATNKHVKGRSRLQPNGQEPGSSC